MLSSGHTKEADRSEQLDLVFRALGDKTRREILSRLSRGPAMVTELAAPFDISLPAVGKHLRVLENAGLVHRSISGRVHNCSLITLPLKNADQWLRRYEKFWLESFDSLAEYISNDSESER